MPRNNDLHKILLIGSGPIVIGQGCEFDYSGVQACKALRDEGYEVVLVNSNPATIMTDPEFADCTCSCRSWSKRFPDANYHNGFEADLAQSESRMDAAVI
jgi:hypothetical protein